jgi:putative ATP-binding cassette transporter
MSKAAKKAPAPASDEAPIVEVAAEAGDPIEPPPPELLEPDAELSPEEAEQARKDYLLTRFWISAKGFWGNNGDRLGWHGHFRSGSWS